MKQRYKNHYFDSHFKDLIQKGWYGDHSKKESTKKPTLSEIFKRLKLRLFRKEKALELNFEAKS